MISIRSASLSLAALAALPALGATTSAQRSLRVTEPYVDTMKLDRALPTLGTLGGVSVDTDGTLYVSNFGNSVWKITPSGRVTLLNDDFILASGNTIAPDGRLIQCDFGFNRVYSVNKDTGQRTVLVRMGLNGPVGVSVDQAGALFIANCNGQNVRRAAPGSMTANLYNSSPLYSCPNGITFGPSGELFISNFFDDNILRIPPGGGVATVFATLGTTGVGGGHLARVGNTLYATKLSSHDLYRVSLTGGSVEVVVGQELQPGLLDGPASSARLRYPNGIAADPRGKVLYTNNLVGPRGGGAPGFMRVRRIFLPR